MRAHSNYIESAPFVLVLVGTIELASTTSPVWLWLVGGLYLLGRVAHGVGMDDGKFGKGRMVGHPKVALEPDENIHGTWM